MRHGLIPCLLLAALLGGCATTKDAENDPDRLYQLGKDALKDGYYETAIKHFEDLAARYPFGDNAAQAQLDLAYAYYKFDKADQAISTADQFIKTYPRHPDADYAYYLRGLADFGQTSAFLDDLAHIDPAQRDPRTALESFQHFAELVKRYPDSRYAPDAVQRMVHLKNYLASHEMFVADYYMKRGAYVAAASRARYVLETYPQTQAVPLALAVMADAYDRLGLQDLAADARRVLELNAGGTAAAGKAGG
jgi:outer membrane protein assembly factor BamD